MSHYVTDEVASLISKYVLPRLRRHGNTLCKGPRASEGTEQQNPWRKRQG